MQKGFDRFNLNLEELRTRKFPNEDIFQADAMDLIRCFTEFHLLAFHTQNEQHIVKYQNESEREYKNRANFIGSANKHRGKLSGIPDIILRRFGIMFCIELKLENERNTKNGGLSPKQIELHNVWDLDCPDVPIFVAYNLLEVYNVLQWVLRQRFTIVHKAT